MMLACPAPLFREPPPSFREGLSKRDIVGMKRHRALISFWAKHRRFRKSLRTIRIKLEASHY